MTKKKQKQNTNALINFVLDDSGSMQSMVGATIEGVNAFLDEQREIEGTLLSLTLFNTGFDVRYVARDLREVPPMAPTGENFYRPNGGTALFDAVATTIQGTEQWLAAHPDWEGKVMCVILTDGAENASKKWHINIPAIEGDDFDVAQLISAKQAQGWEFLFLGSGGSTWLEQTFGHVVGAKSFVGYTHTVGDSSLAYRGVSRSMTNSRLTGAQFTNAAVAETFAAAGSSLTNAVESDDDAVLTGPDTSGT